MKRNIQDGAAVDARVQVPVHAIGGLLLVAGLIRSRVGLDHRHVFALPGGPLARLDLLRLVRLVVVLLTCLSLVVLLA